MIFREGSNARCEGYDAFLAGQDARQVERTSHGAIRYWQDAEWLSGYANAHRDKCGFWPRWYTPTAIERAFH